MHSRETTLRGSHEEKATRKGYTEGIQKALACEVRGSVHKYTSSALYNMLSERT